MQDDYSCIKWWFKNYLSVFFNPFEGEKCKNGLTFFCCVDRFSFRIRVKKGLFEKLQVNGEG